VVRGMRVTLEKCARATILCETSDGSDADVYLREQGFRASVLDIRSGTFGNYCYERRATDPAASASRTGTRE
jgi:hypothetical protein